MQKDFWHKSRVAVLGGGSWGMTLAKLIASNVPEVNVWMRDEEQVRQINSTRSHPRYLPGISLPAHLKAYSDIEALFKDPYDLVIWALPSKVTRELSRQFAPYFKGHELVLHATKGIEAETMKRISQILREELPLQRVGVISGPNLALEVAKEQPSSTVVASEFEEVIKAGVAVLSSPVFRVYYSKDVCGVEWSGTLKNIYAIASGTLDGMNFGTNSTSMMMSRGLSEMVKFGVFMGASESTFLGLAGVGDLIATCSSALSRNYRVGQKLAQGLGIEQILVELGSTAEGVRSSQIIAKFAQERGLTLPIANGVSQMVQGKLSAHEVLKGLMQLDPLPDFGVQRLRF
jgi:glycerol-3-phosphate dehydrogenase (NAD(P)+)